MCGEPLNLTNVRRIRVVVFVVAICCAWTARAQDPGAGRAGEEAESLGFAGRVGRYIQNRALDATDMFRLRLRVGPGLSFGLRGTDYLSFYGGRHRVGYVGLPGSSYPSMNASFAGRETRRGLIFFGINATDDLEHPPQYSPSEFDASLQLLLVGGEFGFDPVEIGDFVVGFVGIDARGDDIGNKNLVESAPYRMEGWQILADRKPETFDDLGHRLEFVREHFNTGLDAGVRDVDNMFLKEGLEPVGQDIPSRFRFGLFAEIEEDEGFELSVDPDFELEVELPNLERRWSVVLTREDLDELPGNNPADRSGETRVGLRRSIDRYHIQTDVGGKIDLPPEAYAGIQWRRSWQRDRWKFLPRVRAYYETEDGAGQVTSLNVSRWMGSASRGLIRSVSAGRVTESSKGWEWEQIFTLAHVDRLLDEERRGKGVRVTELARGMALRAGVFGHVDSESIMDRYRLTATYRCPLYRDWVYLELGPELEWKNVNDWEVVPRFRVGIDAIFWGVGTDTGRR